MSHLKIMKLSIVILIILPIISGKPTSYFFNQINETTCGYQSCPSTDPNKLNVHIIAHSHDDLGWLRTVDQYFYQEVQYVIGSVIPELKKNPARRFIQVETYYFYQWWNLQEDNVKQDVIDLVNQGRLEFINSGWSMNDEAGTHYQSTIDQFTLGHRYLEDLFGECARTKVGWSIDPFGHSREQASIYSQMGFDGFLLGRIDYRDDEKRKQDKTTDMLWTGSANLGSESNLFTSIVYRAYNNPPGFCFDIHCDDPPVVTDEDSPEYNWETRVNDFTTYISDQAAAYPTNNIFITLGDDVQYQSASKNFANIDKLIAGFQKFNPKVGDKEINIFYSTPSCSVKAVNDYVVHNKYVLNVKTDDFLPYATSATGLWTGYFTSRPTSKRFERISNNLLQIAKQVTSLAGFPRETNFKLESALGIMQHHDAITGTEKQEVEKDYHRLLSLGIDSSITNISLALQNLLNLDENPELTYCPLLNTSICNQSKQNKFTVLLYNPLGKEVTFHPQIPVDDGTWQVTGPEGYIVSSQLSDPIRDFKFVGDNLGLELNKYYLIFEAVLPPVGYNIYEIEKIPEKTSNIDINPITPKYEKVGSGNTSVTIDYETGLVTAITIKGETLDLRQELMYYRSSYGSGAWIFSPDDNSPDALPFTENPNVTITVGSNYAEIRQEFADWAVQVIRVFEEDYIEFDWAVGPIDVGDQSGRDIISRFSTSLDTRSIFYTDSNSRELMKRQRNFRPTYEYTNEAPVSANYYPITSRIVLRDEEKNIEFAVITDRAQGATSLMDGQVEIMIHRGLLRDEGNINEHLYEMEYGTGLIARGSFYVTFGKIQDADGPSAAVKEREIIQTKHLQPWIFFPSKPITPASNSFLTTELPEVVHLLTFEKWNNTDNTYLLRLEHILEKTDDSKLAVDVTVDITNLFTNIEITEAKEMTLDGIVPIEEVSRLNWPQLSKEKKEVKRDILDLSITLSPMHIRTFVVSVK